MIKAYAVAAAHAEFTPFTYTMPEIGAHQVDIDVAIVACVTLICR
jgi:hypothetical protein